MSSLRRELRIEGAVWSPDARDMALMTVDDAFPHVRAPLSWVTLLDLVSVVEQTQIVTMAHTQAYGGRESDRRLAHRSASGAGTVLLCIAGLHQAFGLSAGLGLTALPGSNTAPLLDMLRDGWFGAVEPQLDRMVVVWFLFFGFALALFGALLRWLEQNHIATPRGFAFALAGLCALGISLMPVSGFWLALYPAWQLYRVPRPAHL